jgi:hypothetical protein
VDEVPLHGVRDDEVGRVAAAGGVHSDAIPPGPGCVDPGRRTSDVLPADHEDGGVTGFDAELHDLFPLGGVGCELGRVGLCLYLDLDGSHADACHDQGVVTVVVDDQRADRGGVEGRSPRSAAQFEIPLIDSCRVPHGNRPCT